MFEIYRDRAKRWRWRLKAKNGRIIADSGQGYASERIVSNAVYTLIALTKSKDIGTFRYLK